ncbi:MAG: alpha-ketoacid dehydrogenase subunit beta [Polyangiales bacterium]
MSAHVTTYREAIRAGLRKALSSDPRVFLMGEDVGHYGGAYAVSSGLLEEFGPERVRDTPLCESTFVGAGIGAALGGMRPIVEIMTVNFSLLALDQLVNNAAALCHMSGGQLAVPLVVRMATGGGRQLAAQHSHSLENWYASVPGIKVLAPSTPQDGYDMLLCALAEPDPVVIFEHQVLYAAEGELDEQPAQSPDVWHAAVRRTGRDATLVSYGGSMWKALQAADDLARQSIEVEVIDLRCLRPLDLEPVLQSLARTHRLLVVDEAWRTGSLAAEVMARVVERGFYDLDAPPARVCSEEVPVPYAAHLERAALPQAEKIAAAVRELVGHHG